MSKQIQKAKNGEEKQKTYTAYMSQYKKAIRNEFFLEAIMIDYAMMEDRLVALLHYLGIVSRNQSKLSVNKFCRGDIRRLLGYKENAAIRINNISVKIRILNSLVNQALEEDSAFIKAVLEQIDAQIDRNHIETLCCDILEWCEIRNQYVHALLNKNYEALQEGLKTFAEGGHIIARRIDACVKMIKKDNTIRKQFRIK